MGNAFFGDRDSLGLAHRVGGLLADALGGGVRSQLLRRPGAGGEGLTQPDAGLVDDRVLGGAIARGVPLRLWELSGGPGTFAVPDHAGDGGAGNLREAEGEGGGR
jgi:hypothetical protein